MERIVEIGQAVMIARRSSVASGPARPLVIERAVGSNTLKVLHLTINISKRVFLRILLSNCHALQVMLINK